LGEDLVLPASRPTIGLRDGNGDFAIVSDLADEAPYRIYDDEHNRIRRELLAPIGRSLEPANSRSGSS
jgi:hypothetical protein